MLSLCILFKVLILLIVVLKAFCIRLDLNDPIHQDYVTNCLMEIVHNQFYPRYRLLTILTSNMTTPAFGIQNKMIRNLNQGIRWPLQVVNDKLQYLESTPICLNCPVKKKENKKIQYRFQPKHKTQYCVMIVDNFKNFYQRLENFLQSDTQNPRAYFLVYFSEISEQYEDHARHILNTLWEHKVFNSAVMIGRNSTEFFNIYGLDIYASADICGGNPALIKKDTCNEGKVEKKVRLFGNKLPKKFGNCIIPTIAMRYPPFIINHNEGFEVNVLREFGKILNIHFNLSTAEAVDWGTRISKNNWTGPLGIAYNLSAIAIGNVMANPELAEDFTLTVGYFYEHLIWVVPKALPLERWKNIFVIFKYQLWILSIGYFILTAVLFQVTSRSRKELQCFKNFVNNFLISLRVLIGISIPKHPKTALVRAVFMSLATYSMVLIVLYQSSLITYLTNPVLEKQISSVKDILDSGKQIGGLKSYKTFFNVTTDARAMQIFKMFKVNKYGNNTALKWISTVGNTRDICTISSSFYVKFLLTENNPAVTTMSGRPKVFVLKEIVFPYSISMVLPKGFPLAERFDKIIWRLLNGGIIYKWASNYRQHMKKQNETDGDYTSDEENEQLTVDHLEGAFDLLVFGHILSLAVFILEIIFGRLIKKRVFPNLSRCCNNSRKKKK